MHPDAAAGHLNLKGYPLFASWDSLRASRRCRGHPLQYFKQKKPQVNLGFSLFEVLRKEWDSNPRYGKAVRRISSPVHSITLASFQEIRCKNSDFFTKTKEKSYFLFKKIFLHYSAITFIIHEAQSNCRRNLRPSPEIRKKGSL